MITVFAIAGLIVIGAAFVIGTIVLRRSRRNRLTEAAMDFSPTATHLIDEDGSRGSGDDSVGFLSRRSGSSFGSTRLGRTGSGRDAPGASAVLAPAPAPAPPVLVAPVPALARREMRQQGPRPTFAAATAATTYGDSAYTYYGAGRQQQWQQQQQQQQQQQHQRQQQQQQLWQRQEEGWPVPSNSSPDDISHPSPLMPAYHWGAGAQASSTPSTGAGRAPSVRAGGGGTIADGVWKTRLRERSRSVSQVPLPPPFQAPGTLGRKPQSLEDDNPGDDARRYSRILKVVNG